MADGPPPEVRQLNRRSDDCPHCDSLLSDRITWVDDNVLRSDISCQNCDWHAYVLLSVIDPNGD